MPPADTGSVRPGEELDTAKLEAYLRHYLPELASEGQIQLERFPGGHSNLTYLVRFGEKKKENENELVLRRPPLGPVAPTAHDMAREYRWLSALHPVFPKAPRPYLLCEDTS